MSRDAKSELLELLRTHGFRRGDFVLSSGKRSDFFIDCKPVTLTARGHDLVGKCMHDELLRTGAPLAVAGVAVGGCSLASAVAMTSFHRGSPLDAIYVRKESKDHGTRNRIEGGGHLASGASVVIVEDTITTGGSSLRAIGALREANFEVERVVAIVDRCEGGGEAIREVGVEFSSLFERGDFIP